MALEPITRQEQIIAGKDLEPITRMERFLKEYGGGAGGVVSDEQIKNAVENYLDENPIGVDLSVTGATVGQTVTISAVDENGRPLKWEAIGMPGDSWELINDFTVQTDLTQVKITTDKNGNGFNLRKIMVFSHILPCLTALKKDNIKGFLSKADAGTSASPHEGPFCFANGPSATEGKQYTSTFYAEKLSGHYVRVNFTTAYDDGLSYRNQGYVNGLYAPQLINIDELGWTSTNIDMFFGGSWQECIGAGSRFVILGVRA